LPGDHETQVGLAPHGQRRRVDQPFVTFRLADVAYRAEEGFALTDAELAPDVRRAARHIPGDVDTVADHADPVAGNSPATQWIHEIVGDRHDGVVPQEQDAALQPGDAVLA